MQTKEAGLTVEQREAIALAANAIGFTIPVVGEGLKMVGLTGDMIVGIYLYGEEFQVVTTMGSNCFSRREFKEQINSILSLNTA